MNLLLLSSRNLYLRIVSVTVLLGSSLIWVISCHLYPAASKPSLAYCKEAVGKQTSGELSRRKQEILTIHLALWKWRSFCSGLSVSNIQNVITKSKMPIQLRTLMCCDLLWSAYSIFLCHLFFLSSSVISGALEIGQSHVCRLPHVIDVHVVNLMDRAKLKSNPRMDK